MASITHPGNSCKHADRSVTLARRDWLARAVHRVSGVFAALDQSEVDREAARLLRCSGGRFTDSMEREIMRKALVSNWSLPA
jgi:hypothetical protein